MIAASVHCEKQVSFANWATIPSGPREGKVYKFVSRRSRTLCRGTGSARRVHALHRPGETDHVVAGGENDHYRIAEAGELLGMHSAISGDVHELTAETLQPCQVDFIRRDDFSSCCVNTMMSRSMQCSNSATTIAARASNPLSRSEHFSHREAGLLSVGVSCHWTRNAPRCALQPEPDSRRNRPGRRDSRAKASLVGSRNSGIGA